jgi:hypothetical protein
MTSGQQTLVASGGGNVGGVRGRWTDWVGLGVGEQPLVTDSQLAF